MVTHELQVTEMNLIILWLHLGSRRAIVPLFARNTPGTPDAPRSDWSDGTNGTRRAGKSSWTIFKLHLWPHIHGGNHRSHHPGKSLCRKR